MNQKNFYLGLALSIVLIFEYSCMRNSSLDERISELRKNRIYVNTENMKKVKGHFDKKNLNQSRYIYVMYVDSVSCSLCTLKEMNKWVQYMEEMSSYNIHFMPVFVPMKRDLPEFIYRVKAMDLPFTVYIDSLGCLEKDNIALGALGNLNTFMIDKEGQVVIVGNPTRNHSIKELVRKYIEKQNENEYEKQR